MGLCLSPVVGALPECLFAFPQEKSGNILYKLSILLENKSQRIKWKIMKSRIYIVFIWNGQIWPLSSRKHLKRFSVALSFWSLSVPSWLVESSLDNTA